MSETSDERPVAPGIAAAMHNARNATDLTHRHRHRWSLRERDEQTPESTSDER